MEEPHSFDDPPGTTAFSSQGNPHLLPEVARTYTMGAVWTPEFVSGLTMSLDYYRIHMANAIGQIAPGTTIQSICEASGGTSIYCANYQRPLPFSDHSIANFASGAKSGYTRTRCGVPASTSRCSRRHGECRRSCTRSKSESPRDAGVRR